MRSMTFEAVLGTITSGSMASMVEGRTNDERAAIASFVTGKVAGLPGAPGAGGGCVENAAGFLQSPDGPRWNGWGADVSNSRFQPAAMAGLTPEQVPRLKLKWAFGFPGVGGAAGQPTIVGGLVLVGGSDRKVYALDAKSGCTRWAFATDAAFDGAICWRRAAGCLFR
jgi:polyvinyl alcohol dehydrogenase (cytochrome)